MQDLITYEILEDNIKITNISDRNIKIGLILRLQGNNAPISNYFHEFKYKGEWMIPFFDYTGCGILSVHENLYKHEETGLPVMRELLRIIIPKHFTNKSDKQNVICIGLNKTGTSSFTKDMLDLGYSLCPENISHQYAFPDAYHENFNSTMSLLDNPRFNLYEDLPFSLPNAYKKIYEKRPNDLYVLTLRNSVDDFVESVKNYYHKYFINENINNFNHRQYYHHNYFYVDNINLCGLHYAFFESWGIQNTDNLENKLKSVYNKHKEDVINFFDSKNNKNFIVIDVSQKSELKKLTNWLNIKNDKSDFSWENKNIKI